MKNCNTQLQIELRSLPKLTCLHDDSAPLEQQLFPWSDQTRNPRLTSKSWIQFLLRMTGPTSRPWSFLYQKDRRFSGCNFLQITLRFSVLSFPLRMFPYTPCTRMNTLVVSSNDSNFSSFLTTGVLLLHFYCSIFNHCLAYCPTLGANVARGFSILLI